MTDPDPMDPARPGEVSLAVRNEAEEWRFEYRGLDPHVVAILPSGARVRTRPGDRYHIRSGFLHVDARAFAGELT